jgi:pyrimidine operon attenuation protein / uracil phosphoribosyltransferase
MGNPNYILTKDVAARKLHRMALELAEQLNGDDAPIMILGIRNSGMVIADIIASHLKKYLSNKIETASISLDKVSPREVTVSNPIDFTGLHVIIADDVTNSGRTVLFALKPLLEYHPKTIHTLVLVERMHKIFPVKPDFVGLSVSTTLQDHIQVEVKDGEVIGAYVS